MKSQLHIWSLIMIFSLLTASCGSKNGKKIKDNVAYEYYENGGIKVEAEVINDTLAHGIYKEYTPDGYLENVYTYVMGKREGPAVTYYNNGKLRTKLNFKDNKLHGQAKMYYKTGELYRITNYVDGNAEGIRTSYYKNGKIMAEVPYKNNYPGVGIKEYTEDGKLETKRPKIVVQAENHLALEDKYTLKISLSPREPATTFYIGDLEDGKYIHQGLWPQKPSNGVYEYVVNVHKGGFLMESLTISATYRTHHNSWAVVSRQYNLAIDNK